MFWKYSLRIYVKLVKKLCFEWDRNKVSFKKYKLVGI